MFPNGLLRLQRSGDLHGIKSIHAIERQPGQAKVLVRNIRWLLLATWGFYPIVYLLPILGQNLASPDTLVAVQVGYAIADVAAKCGYGLMIYWIARDKTAVDGAIVDVDSKASLAASK